MSTPQTSWSGAAYTGRASDNRRSAWTSAGFRSRGWPSIRGHSARLRAETAGIAGLLLACPPFSDVNACRVLVLGEGNQPPRVFSRHRGMRPTVPGGLRLVGWAGCPMSRNGITRVRAPRWRRPRARTWLRSVRRSGVASAVLWAAALAVAIAGCGTRSAPGAGEHIMGQHVRSSRRPSGFLGFSIWPPVPARRG